MAPSDRPKKTALHVAQRIVDDINSSGNRIGHRLPPERVMLEEYDVGRGTLRESLRFLELQGVITLKPGPNGGPIVTQPDSAALSTTLSLILQFHRTPFSNVLETRRSLEPVMARLAAERRTEEDAQRLLDIVDDERKALDSHADFLENTRRFHTTMAHGSGNVIVWMLFDALFDILDGASLGVHYPMRQRELTVDINRATAKAVAARDAERAEDLVTMQMKALVTFINKHYPEALDAPISWRS